MKCIVCDSDENIEIHHIDQNRKYNHGENLIPICRTHHRLLHVIWRKLETKSGLNYKIQKECRDRMYFIIDLINKYKISDSYDFEVKSSIPGIKDIDEFGTMATG